MIKVFNYNDEENKKALGLIIKMNRVKQNMSQRALAELASINAGYLCTIERCEKIPHEDIIDSIFSALDLKFFNDTIFIEDSLNLFNEIYYNIVYLYDSDDTISKIKLIEDNEQLYMNSPLVLEYFLIRLIAYLSYGRSDEVPVILDILDSIVNLLRDDYLALYLEYKANYLTTIGNVTEAELMLNNAYRITNNVLISTMIKYHMSFLYLLNNDNVESIISIQEARKGFESYGNYKRSLYCQISLGSTYSKIGKIEKSEECYLTAIHSCKRLKLDEIKDFANKNLIWMYLKNNKLVEASALYDTIDTDSCLLNDPLFLYYSSFMFLKLGKVDELNKYLEIGLAMSEPGTIKHQLFLSVKYQYEKNEDYENVVYSIINLADKAGNHELFEFFSNELITMLVNKRKYKEAFELQTKLIANRAS